MVPRSVPCVLVCNGYDGSYRTAILGASSLRILIFGLNYAPELTGIGKYTGEMAAWLAARGHTVRVVTAPPYYPAWRVADAYRGRGYVTESGPNRPNVVRCPLYVPSHATGLKRIVHLLSFALSGLPVMLREICGGPDIIWTVEPTFFCAPIVLAAGKLAGAPTWLHVQDFEVDAAFDLGLLPAQGMTHNFAMRMDSFFTRSFHRVSSISRRMVERTLLKGVAEPQSILFPNWVDINLVQPQPHGSQTLLRCELGLAGKVVFLYSGNMGNKQGLELLPALAAAMQDLPDVHFLFCGDGTYRATLVEAARHLGNVTLLHLQPLERLNDLLNTADVHLLPQRADAADLVMPSKLTGMLSSGRPTLATAEPATQVAAVVAGDQGHAACGVVVPAGNLHALIEAARRLSGDALLRERLGLAARAYAMQHLGRDEVLTQFEEDLDTAVHSYRSPAALLR